MADQISNYQIFSTQELGAGSYGKVFLGMDSITKKYVAIKIINSEMFSKNKHLGKWIRNEIDVLMKSDIKNRHVIQLLDVLEHNQNTYFVYEYCNGGNL